MATHASAPRDECDLVWMSIPSHGIWPERTNSDSICCLVQKTIRSAYHVKLESDSGKTYVYFFFFSARLSRLA